MESRGPKKPRRYKKRKMKSQERFIKKFPFRLSWLTEPSTAYLQSWKTKSNSLKDQLPLQKKLVPTRSIPPPGQDLDKLPPPKADANQPYTSETSGPIESFP